MDKNVMESLSYGLLVLSARRGERDNGCIINTAIQVTVEPNRIALAVSRDNLTHDMVKETGRFTLSILSEEADFPLYRRFGYQSGRTADKFGDFDKFARDAAGVAYVTAGARAWLSGRVAETVDLGSHTLFIADVVEGGMLSDCPSATYAYYRRNVKPAIPPADRGKKRWVCRVCGYLYDGAALPADFICPVCKHPAADFEPLV